MLQNLMILFFQSRHLYIGTNMIIFFSFPPKAVVVSVVELNKIKRLNYSEVLYIARPTLDKEEPYITYFECSYLTTFIVRLMGSGLCKTLKIRGKFG